MLALPLRLPTAPYGGHMGHFLLSTLALMGSTPFGNMASLFVELNSKYLVQDRPHKLYEDVIPALDLGLASPFDRHGPEVPGDARALHGLFQLHGAHPAPRQQR